MNIITPLYQDVIHYLPKPFFQICSKTTTTTTKEKKRKSKARKNKKKKEPVQLNSADSANQVPTNPDVHQK